MIRATKLYEYLDLHIDIQGILTYENWEKNKGDIVTTEVKLNDVLIVDKEQRERTYWWRTTMGWNCLAIAL